MDAPRLPFPRASVLEISPWYTGLADRSALVRVRTPAGDPAWLVTRYAEAKQLWADPLLGRSHPSPEQASRVSDAGVMAGPLNEFDTEQAHHAIFRRLLTPAFSARRMNDLATLITTLVRESIEEMTGGAEHGTADLQRHVSMPLPVFVICRLLGVPFADRYYFKDLSARLATLAGEDPGIAYAELREYVGRIAEAKRTDPGEDLISDLVAAQQEYPGYLTGEQLTGIVAGLLFAGHETTLNAISYGTLALLSNPAAKQRLIAHPETVDEVVEEILRLNASGGIGILRYAHADIEVGEQLIRRGEAVILYSALVDRDPRAYPDAERFAPSKRASTHLGFGHGGYFCIGASLARLELRGVFGQLFRRLPTLTLAAAPEELTPRDERLTGGIERLPVSW